ncbi:MAG: purine-binding chemotaxis protein CheW [Nitrospirae bacterium]|nr:purine-binding chemotaxis protein CheW [Nitrospirota bacterium]
MASAEPEDLQFALVRVGGEQYAVDIMRVEEILRPQKITQLKRGSAIVQGVIDLRGEVIPVVDLRRRVGGADEPPAGRRKERVVVIRLGERKVGLLVDDASEVFRLPPSGVQPPPPTAAGEDPFYAGVATYKGDLIMVLNLDHLFSAKERLELGEAGSEG